MEKDGKKNIVNHFEAGSNCQVFNGNITGCVFAMPGSTVNQNSLGTVPSESKLPEVTVLVACVDNVREYLWKESAMAVIFCVCRDRYCYADNMSQFERDFQCQDGLLSNTCGCMLTSGRRTVRRSVCYGWSKLMKMPSRSG